MRGFLPFKNRIANGFAAALAFALGACFDLTVFRLDPAGVLAGSSLFLLLARVLSGVIFALLTLVLLRATRDLKKTVKIRWKQLLILAVILNAVTALYVLTSRTVYVWDNAGYWTVARTLAEQQLGKEQILEVLKSTITMDYNYLLAWPISLVMRVFGGSRGVFLFSISNLYTLPALWGLCVLGKRRPGGGILLAGLFPMLIYIGLVGYVDVAACALAIWAVAVYTGKGPADSRGICAGFLLVGTFLLRRYFFFFAASFGVAALAVKLLFDRKRWRDFLALFLTSGVCALYFTPDFLLDKVLGTDYGDLYSAYALGLRSDGLLFCRYFGLAVLVALVICGVVALVKKQERGRVCFAFVQLAVCFVAFTAVQSHGQQHLLLYLPCLALLASCAVMTETGVWAWLLAGVVFCGCFLPREQPGSIEEIKGFSPSPTIAFYGPKREDMEELTALLDYVDSLSAGGQKTAVVLASSFELNCETLTNLRASMGLKEPETKTVIRYQGTVDKRDPFNWNTLTADFLIIGDPIQTHLGEENQRVITLFAEDVLSGTGPGSAYEELGIRFELENGAQVKIYRRTRNLSSEEYLHISRRLQQCYPAYEALYDVPDWIK